MKDFFAKIWAWITSRPADKLLHDYAGALITLYAFVLSFLFLSFWPSAIVANVLAVLALVGKEAYDYFHSDTQSVEMADIAYGLFGIMKVDVALGILLIAL